MDEQKAREGMKVHSFDPPDGGNGPGGKTAGYGVEDPESPTVAEPASFDPPDGGTGGGGKGPAFAVGDKDE